jgi:hypothetical protein
LRRAEEGAEMFGVFRVKNHDFTPKNHIFPILGGEAPGAPPMDPPLPLTNVKYLFLQAFIAVVVAFIIYL